MNNILKLSLFKKIILLIVAYQVFRIIENILWVVYVGVGLYLTIRLVMTF